MTARRRVRGEVLGPPLAEGDVAELDELGRDEREEARSAALEADATLPVSHEARPSRETAPASTAVPADTTAVRALDEPGRGAEAGAPAAPSAVDTIVIEIATAGGATDVAPGTAAGAPAHDDGELARDETARDEMTRDEMTRDEVTGDETGLDGAAPAAGRLAAADIDGSGPDAPELVEPEIAGEEALAGWSESDADAEAFEDPAGVLWGSEDDAAGVSVEGEALDDESIDGEDADQWEPEEEWAPEAEEYDADAFPEEYTLMRFVDVAVVLPATNPVLVLEEAEPEGRQLRIPIGTPEGVAIAYAARQLQTPRPLTHALMIDLLEAYNVTVETVRITAVHGAAYEAEIVCAGPAGMRTIPCRPSDGVALALRQHLTAPILAAPEVLDEAGVVPAPRR